jgi:hypothetical protein
VVDPINLTNFNRTNNELEEVILFGILVAGKNAITTSKSLDRFLRDFSHIDISPLKIFSHFELDKLPSLAVVLKDYGFGCMTNKSKGIYQLVRSGLDLRTCTVSELEKIHNIGMKTSRMFVLHTRENAEHIPLDVHILHYLSDLGYSVPRTTPGSKKCPKKYLEVEQLAMKVARSEGKTYADWDLNVWRIYREKSKLNRRKAS